MDGDGMGMEMETDVSIVLGKLQSITSMRMGFLDMGFETNRYGMSSITNFKLALGAFGKHHVPDIFTIFGW
jgi:hypothetical protein